MVGRVYTTFYCLLLNLPCILVKIEVYNAGPKTQGRDFLPNLFLQKVHFVLFFYLFFQRCTVISDLGFDFVRVLKLQYFHPRTQAPTCAER